MMLKQVIVASVRNPLDVRRRPAWRDICTIPCRHRAAHGASTHKCWYDKSLKDWERCEIDKPDVNTGLALLA